MPNSSEPQLAPDRRWTSRITGHHSSVEIALGVASLTSLCVWMAVNWAYTIRAIIHTYNPLPIWDYWRVVWFFSQYKALDFSVLWIQHNEHRIVFPELIFATDMLLFHGRQILPLVASFACYVLIWLVLAAAIRSDKTLPPLICNAGVLLAGVVIGWEGCVVVVGSAFLLQWTMLQLAVTLGLFLLARTQRHRGNPNLAGALACGVIATYSSGNGMLIWPIMILGGLLVRLTRFRFLALVVTAAASTSLYFVGYQSSHDLNLVAMLRHPLYLAGFVASYLSMPFGAMGGASVALIVGYVNLLLFFLILFLVIRRRLFTDRLPILLLGSYLFTLLTAALTAAGRMNPADHQYIAAKAARYVSLPLVNWAVLLLALIWLSSRRKWEVFSPGNIIFIASLIFLAAFSKLGLWVQGNDSIVADQQWAVLSLESGLFSPSVLRTQVYPDPGFVKRSLPTLQENHLSIYWDQPDLSWVGSAAKSKFPGTWTRSLQGNVSQIYPILEGAEIAGFSPHLRLGAQLVLIDGHGEIVGLGERVPAGTPDILEPGPASARPNWVGFLNTQYNSKEFAAYLVKGASLSQITEEITVPKVQEATPAEIVASIPNVTWEANQWKAALPPGIQVGDSYRGAFWSSWNGTDASTGQITSSAIAVPVSHCMIVPILHGPSAQGLSAQIIGARTDRLIERIPMQNGEMQWKLWRLPVDPSVTSIKIVARDAGTGWGQWLAIGTPQQCR